MVLIPGETVWTCARASRAAVLIDGARYFGAVRAALRKARSHVFIVGWDIHSRMALVGESGRADDGDPETLGEFLSALVRARPQLTIDVLEWDFAMLYATERELMPAYALQWSTPPGVNFCLDNVLPIGSSHHQKIVVIDNSVAFCGGLDLTVRRWDTGAHRVDEPRRRDPRGRAYRPFHDVQAMVEGEAARALGSLARERWRRACGQEVATVEGGDRWPDHVEPDFRDVTVGIARSEPAYGGHGEVREVEALFVRSIGQAEGAIYVENQFMSCASVAQALSERLKAQPQLELLLVGPARHDSWLEAHSMRSGRIRFMGAFEAAGVADRVRLVHPQTSDGDARADVMVHSKVMAIDDRYLRIGSANLNNRSMGTDSECDLVFAASTEAHRAAIAGIRNRLLGEHCGCSAGEVRDTLARTGSILTAAETLACNGHRLCPVDDRGTEAVDFTAYIGDVADPERPIAAEEFVSSVFGGVVPHASVPNIIKAVVIGIGVIAAALIWELTPLATLIDPKSVGTALREFARGPWAPVVVASAFVGGGLIMFPVTVLIAATAATFGPWLGFAYAGAGTLLSAFVTFVLGARLGKKTLRDLLGPKLNATRKKIARKGLLAVAVIRMVPIAPFTVVNLVAGASDISLTHYMIGTTIGMLPGIFALSVLGHEVSEIVLHPSASSIALLALAVAGWIVMSVVIQAAVARYWDPR